MFALLGECWGWKVLLRLLNILKFLGLPLLTIILSLGLFGEGRFQDLRALYDLSFLVYASLGCYLGRRKLGCL